MRGVFQASMLCLLASAMVLAGAQNFWVMRLNYGEVCSDQTPSMELLAKVVNQEFVLDDGRHVRLELQFKPGAPTYVDDLLARLRHEQAAILLWRGHPYFLVGAT